MPPHLVADSAGAKRTPGDSELAHASPGPNRAVHEMQAGPCAS